VTAPPSGAFAAIYTCTMLLLGGARFHNINSWVALVGLRCKIALKVNKSSPKGVIALKGTPVKRVPEVIDGWCTLQQKELFRQPERWGFSADSLLFAYTVVGFVRYLLK